MLRPVEIFFRKEKAQPKQKHQGQGKASQDHVTAVRRVGLAQTGELPQMPLIDGLPLSYYRLSPCHLKVDLLDVIQRLLLLGNAPL